MAFMKNKFLVFSAFMLTALLCCGCDFFRSLAGRPTSSDIEAMRVELVRREAAEAARLDSLERVRFEAAEAARIAAATDSLNAMKGYLRTPSRFSGFSSATVAASKYYIVLGSFLDRANAENYCKRLESEGYPAEALGFRNGFTAVGACPTDDPSEVLASLRRLRAESFCPKDVWILLNE